MEIEWNFKKQIINMSVRANDMCRGTRTHMYRNIFYNSDSSRDHGWWCEFAPVALPRRGRHPPGRPRQAYISPAPLSLGAPLGTFSWGGGLFERGGSATTESAKLGTTDTSPAKRLGPITILNLELNIGRSKETSGGQARAA